MSLFAPGMTVLHRAGLGGLACTLGYIDQAYREGALLADELPGAPWAEDRAPWDIDARSITLRFGAPSNAGGFLKRLFKIGFDIKDGLIYLPGQYGQEPNLAVRAELQAGLTLTFLQHGRVRKLEKDGTVFQHDPVGDGSHVTVEYKRCHWYKHQDGWQELVDAKGEITRRPVEVIGPLNPGAVVRHVAYTADTKIEDAPQRVLPLYFAMIGCVALPVNRGVGVLIAPDVQDLRAFMMDRPALTPTTARECRISNAGDAALQSQLRIRSHSTIQFFAGLPGCYAMEFRPTSWASQQKSRVYTVQVEEVRRYQPEEETDEERRLRQFEVALAVLAPRVRLSKEPKAQGRMGKKPIGGAFWAESVVRPLVANNLAMDREWYTGFTRLMTDTDNTSTSTRQLVKLEREGLRAMVERLNEDRYKPEQALVEAMHQAIRSNLRQIMIDTDGEEARTSSRATENRWTRFQERLRLDLTGAKTAEQCRSAICKVFGKAGYNSALQEGRWRTVLPMLADESGWQKARDLALLALASYAGRPKGQAASAADTDRVPG